jgi:hypothetical protein
MTIDLRATAGGRVLVLAAAAALLAAVPASAQPREPIGKFAIDVRGLFARHKQEPSVASDLGVPAGNLPSRSFGLIGGVQVYPVHAGKITFGFGGHVLMARGSRTLDAKDAPAGTVDLPTVRRHFSAIAPEVSLNFGHRSGWSYISGGIGRARLYLDRADAPAVNPPGRQTIHYGAGARWFNTHHLAFAVDVRWYSVAEQPAAPGLVYQPRTTLLVLSGGISIK